MPLLDTGFYRPTYAELLEAQKERAKQLFGEDIDVSEESVLGKYLMLNVDDLDVLYQTLEAVYYGRFPNTATGQNLDRLCVFVGITRNPATYAQHNIVITGTAGATVDMGFELSDGTLTYHTIDDYEIGENGTVQAIVECDEAGIQGNVPAGSITEIVNPDENVEEITHISVNTYATDTETDTALRQRFSDCLSAGGSATINAIRSEILKVSQVQGVNIVENATDSTVDGIPPHSFECNVLAPASQNEDIAKAIFNKKPLGIKAYGDTEVTVYDDSGKAHTVAFTRTAEKPIYIKAKITTNQFFEEDGIALIKNNLIEYISTLKNGETLYYSSLFGYMFVDGVITVNSLTLSTDGTTYATGDITADASEVIRAAADNIIIEVVSNE